MRYSYEDYLEKGQHFEYRIKPTKGTKFPWRIDIWIYRNNRPIWCCTSKYFKTREKAVDWRTQQKKGTESD